MNMASKCCNAGEPDHDDGHGHGHSPQPPTVMAALRMITVACAITGLWFFGHTSVESTVLGFVVVAICGYPIFREAVLSIARLRMTMELSMTIALAAALGVGEVFTSLIIIFFVLVAEELELLTVRRGRKSVRTLLDLLPQTVAVEHGDGFVDERLSNIKAGDTLLVKPGGRICVDGQVVRGNSSVDESAITGESMPSEKRPGSNVFAGTINQTGALVVKATKVGADTAFGKIVEAVEHAERNKAPVQRVADKMSGYIVLFALICAAITFLATGDVRSTISVIIVAGACGVAAGTPLAILGSIGQAAQRGSVVKGGLYLERLAAVDVVVFDKTGTLTRGQPHVVSVQGSNGASIAEVLTAAAAAETKSEHPLARAVLDRAAELSLTLEEPSAFAALPGRGLKAKLTAGEVLVGNRALMEDNGIELPPSETVAAAETSEVFVASGGRFLGRILIADTVRPEAKQAIAELKQLGIRTIMLTGDNKAVAQSVARQLGIDEWSAELKPADKQARVAELEAQGHVAAMVGDGVNDAPALKQSSVAIAVGSGTDVAVESANIVLIGNDLLRFVDTVRVARRMGRVIWFNFAGTLAVDALGMLLAALGFLNPLLAACVHVGSELAFIMNAARLFPIRRKPTADLG
jgi:Cd2+/Zn2+-exporting ATPase/Cu+-exporting ATPase